MENSQDQTPPLPRGLVGGIAALAARLLPPRFVKFAVVGASGMVVNMGALFVLADLASIHTNLASAIAIEVSVLSNFVLNDRWTFADRRAAANNWVVRVFRFHAVSGVGATLQWITFVVGNYLLAGWILGTDPTTVLASISDPPEVGAWKYLSQFVGIGLAAVWNFVANMSWTWRDARPGDGRE